MRERKRTSQQKVIEYFNTRESRWGYTLLLGGTKHFGYYPEGEGLSKNEALRAMEEKLAEKLDLTSNSLVLDAGCGEGVVAVYLAKEHGFRVKGVDLIDSAISKADKRVLSLNLVDRVDFKVMDYTNLGFADEIFDGVYTMESLVHVPDYKQALSELYRVLKPKGRLALFEYSTSPRKTLNLRQQKYLDMVVEESGMHSLPQFIHGRFPKILEKTGFSNILVENITPRVMPMLKMFYKIAYLPYQLIKMFKLQRRFINATAAVEWYRPIIENDIWRYNIITAVKPKR
jgi:ubiquinone/menaquinone biosynthesis C-methylase UbiE